MATKIKTTKAGNWFAKVVDAVEGDATLDVLMKLAATAPPSAKDSPTFFALESIRRGLDNLAAAALDDMFAEDDAALCGARR
jgi:hypothetical protein